MSNLGGNLMPIFVIIIVVSIMFYIFYKVQFFRSNRPAEKKWISAKANIALGLFVASFGINRFMIHQSTVVYIVGVIFIALGVYNIWGGFKAYKYYLPLAAKEATDIKKQM
jgi:hypothetical protein